MIKRYLVIFILFFTGLVSHGSLPDTTGCELSEVHQFDFWIGNWDIHQNILKPDGAWVELNASTSVSPLLDGCALEEHWTGNVQFFWEGMKEPESMKGYSLRFFDHLSGNWKIYWMDSRNMTLGMPFVGGFSDGKGEFFSEKETAGNKQVTRITFSDIKENSVHWDLAFSNDEGKKWTTIWIMEMKRKEN